MALYNEPIGKEIKADNASFPVLGGREKRICPVMQQHEISESPKLAMEFLSRSWSPSASDYLQIFSSNKLLHTDDTNQQGIMNFKSADITHRDSIKQNNKEMDFNHPKTWLRGNPLTRILRSRKEKKKEEARLHTAELHAALSLTQLAAAIAGISRNISTPHNSPLQNGIREGWDPDMGEILSSSAALITTACAEAAESLGAKRAQVRAAVDSGMAIQTPIDMIAATAMAATCLRGAALLKSRAIVEPFTRIQQMLKVGTQICIIMPSGRKESSRVSVYLKRDHLVFSFKRKYFGGALTSAKDYKVTNVTEERLERQENSFLCLKTKNGIIKLSFEDEMQSRIWITSIFNLLEIRCPYWQSGHILSFSH